MAQGNPQSGEFYLHFKNKLYQIITTATHTETEEAMVVYQALYGGFQTYVRPMSMFVSEVDRQKYPEVNQRFRFELISNQELIKIMDDTESNLRLQSDQNLESNGLHPKYIAFIEADTLEERYQLLQSMEDVVTDDMIESMSVVLDIVIPEGQLKDRYLDMKRCMQTLIKYHLNRP